jgi:hypothetical protein
MTSILTELVALCALAVSVVCTLLVLHPKYNDGILGRLGLSAIAIAGFARAATVLSGASYEVSNVGALLWIGLAIFLLRHFRNFHKCKNRPDADPVSK